MQKKDIGKIVILIALVVAFALFAAQQKSKQSVLAPTAPVVEEAKPVSPSPAQDKSKNGKELSFQKIVDKVKEEQPGPAPVQKLPRLIELGSKSCVPCQMMAPILEDLRNEYKGKLQVEFIDVWEDRSAGDQYRIRVIPTQIFFDPSGEELFRHEGFMSKEDILSKWQELGFDLTA